MKPTMHAKTPGSKHQPNFDATSPRKKTSNRLAAEMANVATYVESGLASNTMRAYASDLRHFKHWGGRIPATPSTVARYLVECAKTLKVSTIARHMAAIAREHNRLGLQPPTQSAVVKATMRGIRRIHGCSQKQAKPITSAMIRRLVAPIAIFSELRNSRDRALLLLGFSGGFRRSELVNLTINDLSFEKRGLVVHLRTAKTDQNGFGRDIAILNGNEPVCPVKALKEWIKHLQHNYCENDNNGVVFRKIDRFDRIAGGLSGAGINWILRTRMQAKRMDVAGFSAHSLRAGLVSSAAMAGVPIWEIQRQTGHRSESMVHRYIRNVGLFDSNVSSRIF